MDGHPTAEPSFSQRHATTYRVAYRLVGDPGLAREITSRSLAKADARLLPLAPLIRLGHAVRAAATAALAVPEAPAGPLGRTRLRRVLADLPTRQREVFVLVGLAGFDVDGAAEVLGISPLWCTHQYDLARLAVEERSESAGAPATAPGVR